MPTLKQIWTITPYPQGNDNIQRDGSWADDIDTRGIGGLEYYIYVAGMTIPNSRSKVAFQRNVKDPKTRGRGEFGSISYIRDLMKEFVKNLK